MTNAKRDENGVTTKTALSNADGTTILSIQADPTTHGLLVSDGVGGAITTATNAPRDENNVPVMMAVSSVDGVTLVPLAIDSATGKLLVKST